MKNELNINSNTLSLLSPEVEKQIVQNNYQIVFNTEVNINKRLFVLMNMLGIPSNIAGYNYIKDALQICIENNYKIPNVTTSLYPTIAKNYEKKPSQIERAIRHAIDKSISRCEPSILFQIFGYTIDQNKNKLTNSEFISQLTNFFEAMCN